ncbi:pancreatic triacylglycerol lipase [Harpegnathos saltator]|uniref:phospholipase A1 n=1 Tax=Harpegnathos saltator TaxID=610380 RepID=E2B986_HARSA|nr:pancreatic triacylglycerol lipase [Harpegnathos saltator]EFN87734.1 Pancreatic triacylglycerol lipase [Harpegnathos saltator]
MEARVLISFLLCFSICCVAGRPAKKNTLANALFSAFDYDLIEKLQPHVYDNDNNLVKLTLEDHGEIEGLTDDDMDKNVFFYLYTWKNPTHPQMLYVNDEEILKNSFFDPKKPTRFVTHGWMNSYESDACTLVRDAYLKHDDYNVIVIDWSNISMKLYIWASSHVEAVGKFVASMIRFLEKHGMDTSQATMVGHSLGAHVVGIAAHNSNGRVNYVVGLDPALPGFLLAGPGSRISKNDASHVEIIHTNGGLLGFMSDIGHSDFYPNGGSSQKGCGLDVGGACSHSRSYMFFAESVNSPVGFVGTQCDSFLSYMLGWCDKQPKSIMGGPKTAFNDGIYYLMTKSSSPFAKGK